MDITIYFPDGTSDTIEWMVGEDFTELHERFHIFDMKAETIIQKYPDISEYSRILLSAVAGAVIQHIIDAGLKIEEGIYFEMEDN